MIQQNLESVSRSKHFGYKMRVCFCFLVFLLLVVGQDSVGGLPIVDDLKNKLIRLAARLRV
jgi:hypothetical protein